MPSAPCFKRWCGGEGAQGGQGAKKKALALFLFVFQITRLNSSDYNLIYNGACARQTHHVLSCLVKLMELSPRRICREER